MVSCDFVTFPCGVLGQVWYLIVLIPDIYRPLSFHAQGCGEAILPHMQKNRGSNMSAHVLLNLLNELEKRDKMRGLRSILSLFRNEFNKFKNTSARMLESIYHMTLRLF